MTYLRVENIILPSNFSLEKAAILIFKKNIFTLLVVSGKLAANLGPPRCTSLRFSLIGSLTLISQWAIMLDVMIITARAGGCYYPCAREAVTTAQ